MHTYIDTGNTGVVIDTLNDRIQASDVTHGAPGRFLESDIVKAREDKHLWSRDLEWHIENYSNYYDPNEGWWYRFDAMGPIAPACRQTEVLGGGDEEKRACGISHLPGPCVIISVGCNNQWMFETSVVEKTNCTVHTFDCTGIGKNWSVPEAISSRVTLHLKCLGESPSKNGRLTNRADLFVDYHTMLSMAGVVKAPAYMKMDIEGWEWEVLRSMLKTDVHNLPKQIAMEFHYHNWETSNEGMPWADRDKTYAEIATFMDSLWRFGGYYVIDRRDNGSCPACSEILLVRIPHSDGHVGASAHNAIGTTSAQHEHSGYSGGQAIRRRLKV